MTAISTLFPDRTVARNVVLGVAPTCVGPGEGGRTRTHPELTKDTPVWYAGTRAEVRAALEQAQELKERLGEQSPSSVMTCQDEAKLASTKF